MKYLYTKIVPQKNIDEANEQGGIIRDIKGKVYNIMGIYYYDKWSNLQKKSWNRIKEKKVKTFFKNCDLHTTVLRTGG
ncbi:hypothetical protein TU62_07725 [Bacillus cereus]|nr:hypothetical protein TU62_07725 [Bacillus cereus]PFZ86653.1 hypothetical protein COL83_28460 [Bacillus wiedmannii]